MQAEAKAKIKEVFDSFDANKNGFIEKDELKDTLTHLLGAQPTQIQIDKKAEFKPNQTLL